MSWDILIINSKTQVDIDADDYPEFSSRKDFIEKVKRSFPETDWSDPAFGILDSDEAVIEFNVGDEDEIGATVLLNVYGGDDPVREVARLCKENGWQAYDIATENYLDLNNPSSESWDNFQSSREYLDD
jgi:hypothetical protein